MNEISLTIYGIGTEYNDRVTRNKSKGKGKINISNYLLLSYHQYNEVCVYNHFSIYDYKDDVEINY